MNTNKSFSESKRVSRVVRAKKQQCYKNSVRVIRKVPEYKNADYVEGYAIIDGNLCIEHGWVEQDGVVIDTASIYGPGYTSFRVATRQTAGGDGITAFEGRRGDVVSANAECVTGSVR